MTEPGKTYTRLEVAEIFGVSNTIVRRNLQAVKALGFSGLLTSDNRLTERAIELISLYREKNTIALDEALAAEQSAPEAPAEILTSGSVTLADRCGEIAANVGTVEVMSSEPYEKRASAAKSALAQFVATNNARSQQLANHAAATRRSFEQLGQEHAIGHLMTYAESMNKTLAEGMAAMQNGAVNTVDRMGNAAAADIAS